MVLFTCLSLKPSRISLGFTNSIWVIMGPICVSVDVVTCFLCFVVSAPTWFDLLISIQNHQEIKIGRVGFKEFDDSAPSIWALLGRPHGPRSTIAEDAKKLKQKHLEYWGGSHSSGSFRVYVYNHLQYMTCCCWFCFCFLSELMVHGYCLVHHGSLVGWSLMLTNMNDRCHMVPPVTTDCLWNLLKHPLPKWRAKANLESWFEFQQLFVDPNLGTTKISSNFKAGKLPTMINNVLKWTNKIQVPFTK